MLRQEMTGYRRDPASDMRTRQVAVCLIALCVSPLCGLAAPKDEAEAAAKAGDLALEESHWAVAVREYQRALDVYHTLPGTEALQAACLRHLGTAFGELEQFQKDVECQQEALRLLAALPGEDMQRARCLHCLGTAYFRLDQTDPAAEATRQALALYRKLPDTEADQAACLRNLGAMVPQALGADGKIDLTQQALELFRKLPATEAEQVICLEHLAVWYGDLRQNQRRTDLLLQALEMFRKAKGAEWDVPRCLSNVATSYVALGKHDDALRYFAESERLERELVRSAGPKQDRWVLDGVFLCEGNEGGAYRTRGREGDLYNAYRCLARALQVIEALRSRAATVLDLRTRHFSEKSWVYEDMIELLTEMRRQGLPVDPARLEENDPGFWDDFGLDVPRLWPGWRSYEEAAFHYSEALQARSAQELLTSQPLAYADPATREGWLRVNKLAAEEDTLLRQQRGADFAGDKAEVEALRARLQQVGLERRGLEAKLWSSIQLAQPRSLDLGEVQKLLAPDEVLVEYRVFASDVTFRGRLCILVVTRSGMKLCDVALPTLGPQMLALAWRALLNTDVNPEAGLATIRPPQPVLSDLVAA